MNFASNLVAGVIASLVSMFLVFCFDSLFACVFEANAMNAVILCLLIAAAGVCIGWLLRSAAMKAGIADLGSSRKSEEISALKEKVGQLQSELDSTKDPKIDDFIQRVTSLSESDQETLMTLMEMDWGAAGFVHSMYVDTFADADTEVLNSIDAPGLIRKIAHLSSDQPNAVSERGFKIHRYRLNEGVGKIIDQFPEVFDKYKEMMARLEKAKSYEPYVD